MQTRIPKKMLPIGAIGLLLGFGLCGLDFLMPGHNQGFGGTSAFLGFLVCIASIASIVVALLWLSISRVVNSIQSRKQQDPH